MCEYDLTSQYIICTIINQDTRSFNYQGYNRCYYHASACKADKSIQGCNLAYEMITGAEHSYSW